MIYNNYGNLVKKGLEKFLGDSSSSHECGRIYNKTSGSKK